MTFVWLVDLATQASETTLLALLSVEERNRAERFHAALHRQRFIAAHGYLRKILSLYVAIPAEALSFAYTEHHKPYLNIPDQPLIQFNLAHSADIALIAITKQHAIGVDIEKIKDKDIMAIAKRFFSPPEITALQQLPVLEQLPAFFRLWTRKEALVKAIGKGLSISLSSFSVSIAEKPEQISLENRSWSLVSLAIHPDFQSALASDQPITSVSIWRFFDQKPLLDKVYKW